VLAGREREACADLVALLRREIPNGDPGVIFDRALTLLLESPRAHPSRDG